MKITKTYDLDDMHVDHLKTFLELNYDYFTKISVSQWDQTMITSVWGKILATFDGNYGKYEDAKTFKTLKKVEDWYKNKIKELENENN